MGPRFNRSRFFPFIVMHEFEALLFGDCHIFSEAVGSPGIETQLVAVREQFRTPEEINDSNDTAPSKRIQALLPRYQKPLHGVLAVLQIGLDRIRSECPHFDA